MRTCKYCGQPQEDSYSFCYNCGAKIDEVQPIEQAPIQETPTNYQSTPETNYQNTSNKKSSGNKFLPIIVLLFIIILVTFIFKPLIFKNNTSTNNIDNNNINNTDNNTNIDNNVKATYKVGDAVTLVDDSKWHVMNVSGENITLLLDKLVVDKSGYSSKGGDEFHQKYENSDLKIYIEQTYLPELKTSLENNGGDTTNLKARLITAQEFLDLTGHKLTDTKLQSEEGLSVTKEQKKNQDWLSMTNSFWTMTNLKEMDPSNNYYGAYSVFILLDAKLWSDGDANAQSWYINNSTFGIRPVIETTTKNIK